MNYNPKTVLKFHCLLQSFSDFVLYLYTKVDNVKLGLYPEGAYNQKDISVGNLLGEGYKWDFTVWLVWCSRTSFLWQMQGPKIWRKQHNLHWWSKQNHWTLKDWDDTCKLYFEANMEADL